MLEHVKIKFERRKDLGHEEFTKRMFGMSKQPVENEKQMFYYNYLTDIEYYEFMCRVAHEYFHVSFSEIEEVEDEE